MRGFEVAAGSEAREVCRQRREGPRSISSCKCCRLTLCANDRNDEEEPVLQASGRKRRCRVRITRKHKKKVNGKERQKERKNEWRRRLKVCGLCCRVTGGG